MLTPKMIPILNKLIDVFAAAHKEGALHPKLTRVLVEADQSHKTMEMYLELAPGCESHVYVDVLDTVAEELAGLVSRNEIPLPLCNESYKAFGDEARLHCVYNRGDPMLYYVDIDRSDPATSRIYIVLRESILSTDLGHSCLSIAHAMMAASHEWKDDEFFEMWRKLSFRKFVGIANEKEWKKLQSISSDYKQLTMHEGGVEGNPELSMIFEPMGGDEVPNVLKHLRPLSWDNVQAPTTQS